MTGVQTCALPICSKTNSTLNPKLDLSWLKLCLVTTHKRLATHMIMNRLLRVRRCSGWQLGPGSMENWRNPRLRDACLQWFSVLVRDLPAAGGNFWRYTYLFEENVYHFRRPNRSYHEEKRCERVGKRCIFSGAPDGAIKSFKGLLPGYITMVDKTIQNQPKHIYGGVLRYSIVQNVCVKWF